MSIYLVLFQLFFDILGPYDSTRGPRATRPYCLTETDASAHIREFREALVKSRDDHHQELTTFPDFFGLSDLRDLIFHIQEHRFTIPKIEGCLTELGLKFCGFDNKDVISNSRELHGKEADIYDLELWHQYEERNPRAFAGMYQFWCQKP